MKKIIVLLFVFLCFGNIKAQDTIIKINGEVIVAKITEINPTEIKFKRFNLPDGPSYIEAKSNIRTIKFSNGIVEKIDPSQIPVTSSYVLSNKIEMRGFGFRYQNRNISEGEMHKILLQSKNKKIINLVRQAKNARGMQFMGFGAIPLGVLSLVFVSLAQGSTSRNYNYYTGNYTTTSDNSERATYYSLAVISVSGAVACLVNIGISKHNRFKYTKEAVKLYNEEQPF